MPHDTQSRGGRHRGRINMHLDYEVLYWTLALGISKEQLADLVARHGNSAEKVRAVLESRNSRCSNEAPDGGTEFALSTGAAARG